MAETQRIEAPLAVTGTLMALGDLTVGDDLTVTGDLDVAGTIVYTGSLEVADNVIFSLGNDNDQAFINRSAVLNAATAVTGVVVGTPVTAAIPANSLIQSNVTADGDQVFMGQTGGNSQEWLRYDASAKLVVVNEASGDVDVRVETDGNANALNIDGGTNSAAIGSAVVAGSALSISNLTGRDTVTSVGVQAHVPAATFNDTAGAATIAIMADVLVGVQTHTATNARTYSDAATIYVAGAPVASTNVTQTRSYAALFDADTVRVDGTLQLGLAGSVLGVMTFNGNTSGTVTVQSAAAAGTWALTLPVDDGDAGEQLQTDGNGITSWEAAGSLRAFKHIGDQVSAALGLERILDTPIYAWRYRKPEEADTRITTTGDYDNVYVGPMAEDAPWAMHHRKRIFDPVSAFGHACLAIQALAARVTELEAKA